MSTSKTSDRWLLLLYSLPAKKASDRVNLWRKLKKFGAYPLKTSAYVLPNAPIHLERFQWLAKQVQDDGGEATLARVTNIDGVADEALAGLFNNARAEEYGALAKPLNALISANRKTLSEDFAGSLEKIRNQFSEIRAIDYFDCPASHDVEILIQRATELLTPPIPSPAMLDAKRYQRRIWLTRSRPEIDRVGSAWLIQKHIDPKARFVFATEAEAHKEAIPYDMRGAEFTHHGDDCTFETLLKRFGIADSSVRRIGEMIHDADLEDGKYQRPECIGLDLLFKGWGKLGLKDSEILEKGFACFDALQASIQKKT